MNKKGLESLMLDPYGFITLAILLVIFLLLMYLAGTVNANKSNVDNVINPSEILLLNYLRSDVEVDLNNDKIVESVNMADLIVMSFDNEDYNKKLKEATKNILSKAKPYGEWGWRIIIKNDDKILLNLVESPTRGDIPRSHKELFINATIPNDDNKIISIIMYPGYL